MKPFQRNPVFWLMWLIPGAAVLAGLSMVALAMQSADRALPEMYHWEGERLDADFERARFAARHGLSATLDLAGGVCTVTIINAPAEAGALQLQLTNGRETRLDRTLTLSRVGSALYRAPCASLLRGRWRLALQDEANTWSLRAAFDGELTWIALQARDPAGPGA